jgi:ABC-type multidrug transport system ATPase subunit/ABC-type multidrug transport system permease subunit
MAQESANGSEVDITLRYQIEHRVHDFVALRCNGTFLPSTSTAILAAPGAGSTLFLRLLSGVEKCQKGSSVLYNGQSDDDLLIRGVNVRTVTAYLAESDFLEPELTVLETCEFVASFSKEPSENVTNVLSQLDLTEAQHTIAGEPAKRGLSGGQRRRLSLAQRLLSKARLFFLDLPTTGLDAVTANAIMTILIEKTRRENGILVTTLQQPSPELLAEFDQVILFEGGIELFHGPPRLLQSFLLESGVETSEDDDDLASIASTFLNSFQRVDVDEQHHMTESTMIDRLTYYLRFLHLNDVLYFWKKHPPVSPVVSTMSPPSVKSSRPVIPFAQQLQIIIGRQIKLISRNQPLLVARLASTTVMAVILATMILGDAEEFQQLYGIILFSAIFFAMSNNAEIPTMKRSRDVVYFDLNVSLYSPLAYMIGVVATTLPLALVAGIIYTSIVYWSCGFSPVFSLYLYFLLVLFCLDQGIGAFLRLFSIAAKSSDVGSSITTSFIGLWILVGGFYLVRSQIPNWLSWLVWVSPFWYTLSGVAISEFNSAQYPNGQGDAYLSAFDVPDSSVLQGLAPVALLTLWLMSTLITAFIFSYCRYNYELGSKRRRSVEVSNDATLAEIEARPFSLRITPTTLFFKDLSYTILSPTTLEPIVLLKNVSGFARPGRLIALMGATGSGKTTLLDVLSLRKTIGTTTGKIMLVPGGSEIAYGEQFDNHIGFSTVKECLVFSNTLRLHSNGSITQEQRDVFIKEVMEHLELDHICDHLVHSLSRGELKRLTVAVEVASNSPVLCLDEPTTGLDSASAAILIRCLTRLAKAGRTIICTIHQPSHDVFVSFDDTLILQAGGLVAYFGPVGINGEEFFSFVESATRLQRPRRGNRISWALSALAAQRGGGEIDVPALFSSSTTALRNSDFINVLLEENAGSPRRFQRSGPVRSVPVQFVVLLDRHFKNLHRNKELQLTRAAVAVFIAVLLGVLYSSVDYSSSFGGTQSLMGLLLGGIIFGSIVFLQTQLSSSFSIRPAFYRELSSKVYFSQSFSLATLVSTLPFVIITSLIFSTIVYWMAGLRSIASSWLFNCYCFVIAAIFYSSLGFVFSSVSPTAQVGQVLGGLSISLLGLSAGLFVPEANMPKGWVWLMYACPPFHLLRAAVSNQLYCVSPSCPKISLPSSQGNIIEVFQYDYVSEYFSLQGFSGRYLFGEVGFAAIGIAFVSFVYILANAFIKFEKR